jgi:hypothetical protein
MLAAINQFRQLDLPNGLIVAIAPKRHRVASRGAMTMSVFPYIEASCHAN